MKVEEEDSDDELLITKFKKEPGTPKISVHSTTNVDTPPQTPASRTCNIFSKYCTGDAKLGEKELLVVQVEPTCFIAVSDTVSKMASNASAYQIEKLRANRVRMYAANCKYVLNNILEMEENDPWIKRVAKMCYLVS